MGRFIVERRRHYCHPPSVTDDGLLVGSLWQCDCSLVWKLSRTDGQLIRRTWRLPRKQSKYSRYV